MIPSEQLERWKEWTEAHAALMGVIGEYPSGDVLYIAAMPALIAEVGAQAKEIERMRAALRKVADEPCFGVWNIQCPSASPECSDRWCASCIARAALKEAT